jgi:hypothetical protein
MLRPLHGALHHSLCARAARVLRPRGQDVNWRGPAIDLGNAMGVVVELRHMTLTLFYILVFMAPIVIAFLSTIFLGEGLSWKKLTVTPAGFAGARPCTSPVERIARRGLDWS